MPRKSSSSLLRPRPQYRKGSSAGNKRHASTAAVEAAARMMDKKDVRQKAAVTLQRAWRSNFRYFALRKLVQDFQALGPTIQYVKSISFEQLVIVLREKKVIGVTRRLLQRLHLLCIFRHGSPSRALRPESVNVRVFLAGFMIAFRPTHVFESMGALEDSLLEAATPLLHQFSKMYNSVQQAGPRGCFSDVPSEVTEGFCDMLREYLVRFKAWKVPDEIKLTQRIKHALIALYQAEEHLPPDEPEDSRLKLEFRTQIDRLRGKLSQIAGSEALDKFDEDRLVGRLPPSSDNAAGGGGGGGRGGGGSGGANVSVLPGRMSNEQLAHELLLDPTFQLDELGGCSMENPMFHRIRDSFHRAFWDSLVDDLCLATPCYVRVLRVLCELRDGLCDLGRSPNVELVKEVLDIDLISAQVQAGAWTWPGCIALVNSMLHLIEKMQSSTRVEGTKAKWSVVQADLLACEAEAPVPAPPAAQEGGGAGVVGGGEHFLWLQKRRASSFCKALEFFLDRVNAMRTDAANARLRLIAPVIKDHGIDYERGKFQDKLNDGSLTLDRTRSWIRLGLRCEVAAKELDLEMLLEGKAKAFVHLHCACMVHLVVRCREEVFVSTAPETLLFDLCRLNHLKREFAVLAAAATVTVTVMHLFMPRAPALVGSIVDVFLANNPYAGVVETSPEETTLQAIQAEVQGAAEDVPDAVKGVCVRAVTQCMSPTDPVHRLMASRLEAVVKSIMWNGKRPEDGVLGKMANRFPLFGSRIDCLAGRLMSLSNLNRTVHLPTYNKLIGEEALALKAEQ